MFQVIINYPDAINDHEFVSGALRMFHVVDSIDH